METLFITNELKEKLNVFCSQQLIESVFDDFEKNGQIIVKRAEESPSKTWMLSDYLSAITNVNLIDKINVSLSFIESGGIIELFDRSYMDISNPLSILRQRGIIDDDVLEFVHDPWFYYHSRQIAPFFDKGGIYKMDEKWYYNKH